MALPFAVLAALFVNTCATIFMHKLAWAWRMLTHLAVWSAFGFIAYTVDCTHSAGNDVRLALVYQNFTSALAAGGFLFVWMHDGMVSLVVSFLRWSFLKMRRMLRHDA
ncbi:hypothetical protein [Verrucomicrobium sp. BvORR106]|uniref:hypothetical protein n=1 Tax=Verrucomicrobium sp. BvORR106 TaxID=1403819 RepID=UPI0005702C87|nr:hypothetical protein [Verrucomicrobium sp. BvORR106]